VDPHAERLRRWASVNGFGPGDDDETELSWLPLRMLSGVVDREVDHVLEGLTEDTEVAMFELRQGSVSLARVWSCALVAVPYGFPPLILANLRAPVGIEHLLAEPRSPSAPSELDGAFEVLSDDPGLVTALLRDELLGWLIEWSDRPPPIGFEVGGAWLLAFAPFVEPELLPDLLDGLLGFRDRIPEPVFDLYPMPSADLGGV
jgi:hypothetical protein